MPDGLQSLQVVLNQAPAVEKVQDTDLRGPQYLQQTAVEADLARAARAQSQVQSTDRSQTGRRVSTEGGHPGGGQIGGQDRPARPPRETPVPSPAGTPPRPGGIVDVVV
jgi:hypothetical protein